MVTTGKPVARQRRGRLSGYIPSEVRDLLDGQPTTLCYHARVVVVYQDFRRDYVGDNTQQLLDTVGKTAKMERKAPDPNQGAN